MHGEADLGAAWAAAMRAGDFERAWEISDRVLASRIAAGRPSSPEPRHLQWLWDGRPLAGRRVLVHCYHGLGDTLQFARFLPRLGRIAREVTVWAQPALIPLLDRMPGIGHLLPLDEGPPPTGFEADIELMELPHALRITEATLPAAPYLSAPAAPRLSGAFGVGIVAGAGAWDRRRSVPPEALARLADIPGVALFNLQPGATLPGTVDASTPDVLAAATRVRALDLIVTVDTMMAHLAGALGAPVWTLLHADADWRWMEGRADSPWYETMRLFRQKTPGDWTSVVEAVAERLRGRHGRPLA